MAKLIMTYGLPASGKSTWAKEYIAQHPNTKRVNKDDLRTMLDNGAWSKDNEKFVLKIRDGIITNALQGGLDIICDDTNLAPKHIAHLRQLAYSLNAEFESKDFSDVPLEVCIERDKERPNYVGEKVIRSMYRNFLRTPIEKILLDPALPSCYIFDIDGTLAKMNGRGAYEWDKVDTDHPNVAVGIVCRSLDKTAEIIFVSGRDGSCFEKTASWIREKVGIEPKRLLMRTAGDMRDDRIVKEEIYRAHIRGKYNVLAIFDDRDKVVRMWREFGLPCFQVDDGDF